MNGRWDFPRGHFAVGSDPFHCLRCFSIAVAIWNILYCLLQFVLLGWQVQVVKRWQWHWENRELPVTGAIDQYQARFPGLYAIYTETPERRRVNAMYAIVLICLGLTIVHFFLSTAMLYGCVKRLPQWLFPWFFSSLPLIVLSTAYSVLWWSGDVFNEQLTFSVAHFAMSLAVNGVCFVVVLLYYLRLRGKLTSDRTNGQFSPDAIQQQKMRNLPPWGQSFPDKVPANIARKLRRKERRERQLSEKVRKKSAERAQRVQRGKSAAPRGRPNEWHRHGKGPGVRHKGSGNKWDSGSPSEKHHNLMTNVFGPFICPPPNICAVSRSEWLGSSPSPPVPFR